MKATLYCLALAGSLAHAQANSDVYIRHGLVSDLAAQAEVKDPNLVNPWGIATLPDGPFWINDNGTGVSTLYNTAGRPYPPGSPLVVTVPPPMNGMPPSAPTGIAANTTTSFQLPAGGPALFIFATEDGTISAWNLASGTNAILKVTTPLAVYKGIAIAHNGTGDFIYATNFHAGTVDVFDTNFAPAGSFTDPTVPAGFAPFGIANIGGSLFVTFALQDADKHDDVAGPGNGFVDMFLPDGTLKQRLASNAVLNSPWGLVQAPSGFGAFSNALLVGNFGDGTIQAFDISTGAFIGTLREPSRRPLVIQGLWGLIFGNGVLGGDIGTLYFTAGIPGPNGNIEDHGLFGSIRPQHP